MTSRLIIAALLLAASSAALRAQADTAAVQPAAPLAATPSATATPKFGRAELLTALSAEIGAHYAVAETLDVDLVRLWAAPKLAGSAPVSVRVLEFPEVLAPSMLVRVRLEQDKTILREEVIALRVSLWRDTMVASAPMNRGDALSLQSIETRRVDALRDRDSLPLNVANGEYVFARAIPAGRALTWRDVMRRSLVQRGQMVEVSATDGGALVVTMKALAMQDGARGDAVRVRNLESKREFIAKVTAENRAEVRF